MMSTTTNSTIPRMMASFARKDEGMPLIFFVSLPFPIPFSSGSPMVTPASKPACMVAIREDEDDEPCFVITQKGKENQIFSSPIKPQRSRKQPHKKRTSSINRKGRAPRLSVKVSEKQALQTYQNELVAHTSLPVHNPFTPLRIVKKNSSTAQIRSVWEIPQPKAAHIILKARATADPLWVTNPATAI